MHRRPWPLVFLAFVQFLTPLMSLIASAHFNHVDLQKITVGIWYASNWLERFQFFVAPIVVGCLIYWARLWGFFLVVLYGFVVTYLNIQEWKAAAQPVSILSLIGINSFAVLLVAYLFIPKVRAIFFNARLRWWETKPRYIVNLSGEVQELPEGTETHTQGRALPCTVTDLSEGGGGLDAPQKFAHGSKVEVSFHFEQETFRLLGTVVYGRDLVSSYRFGVEWRNDSPEMTLKYRELISYFHRNKYPVTRKPPEWRADLLSWLDRAKKSPTAWIPEVTLKAPGTSTPAPTKENNGA